MTSKSVEEIAKEYADKKCLEIQRRRNLGLDPYLIHAAIIDDVKYGYQLSQDRIAELQEAFDTAYNTGEYLKQELDKLKAENEKLKEFERKRWESAVGTLGITPPQQEKEEG